ncbi:MAG TPA: class I SAM-dependent methyltransferase [Halieaceae bacterium]|nr:MAG: methyltransferase type 11 [Gammaproteobacteria bacterium]HDY81446.1 class I SAM-dependent methyltransferase [Halieaceae bacterium]
MSNDIIIEAWNTVLFDKYVRFKHLFVEGLASHSDYALARQGFLPGMKVLDIGCGFGDSTIHIAKKIGGTGEAIGVDCAEKFIAASREDAAAAGVDNTRFFVADVGIDDLGGPYDQVFSRFGTMFFNLPGAAFKNVRKSLKPGGKFTQVVWRKRQDNPWLHDAELCVKTIVPVISHEETDAVHCGPGPFSMAGPDMVSDMLRVTGYEGITFERFDSDISIGRNIDEAIEFAMAYGPAGEIIRLAEEEGERLKPEVMKALRDVLGNYVRDDGSVWAPSSAWIISAYNPQ